MHIQTFLQFIYLQPFALKIVCRMRVFNSDVSFEDMEELPCAKYEFCACLQHFVF
jgi:hypothetical protein